MISSRYLVQFSKILFQLPLFSEDLLMPSSSKLAGNTSLSNLTAGINKTLNDTEGSGQLQNRLTFDPHQEHRHKYKAQKDGKHLPHHKHNHDPHKKHPHHDQHKKPPHHGHHKKPPQHNPHTKAPSHNPHTPAPPHPDQHEAPPYHGAHTNPTHPTKNPTYQHPYKKPPIFRPPVLIPLQIAPRENSTT